MIEENDEAIITLNHVEGSNIDFDQLFGTQYLKIRSVNFLSIMKES